MPGSDGCQPLTFQLCGGRPGNNLFYLIGYISPINWKTIGAVYLSSFFFDLSHGVCTFLVLWAVGEPWTRKLNRVKVKFGLTGEDRHYTMPPGRQSRRAQECQ